MKSNSGLLIQAKRKYPAIDFKTSWFIGDSGSDVEAGKAVGVKTYLIKSGESLRDVVLKILNFRSEN